MFEGMREPAWDFKEKKPDDPRCIGARINPQGDYINPNARPLDVKSISFEAPFDGLKATINRAVAAERERCAKIADIAECDWENPDNPAWSDEYDGMRMHEYIAARIRSGK